MADDESGRKEAFFTNTDGKKIFCNYWCEDLENPRYCVFFSRSRYASFLHDRTVGFIALENFNLQHDVPTLATADDVMLSKIMNNVRSPYGTHG